MNARSCPSAVCSACNAYSYDKSLVNTVCQAKTAQGTCKGFWQNREHPADWMKCRNCSGTGYVHTKHCPDCASSGWIPRPQR